MTDSIMLTLVQLITISLFSYVGLAESVAAQSSAMQNSMSSVFLEELLRELHVDEIIDDAGGERVIARGILAGTNDGAQMSVGGACDANSGRMLIPNAPMATQHL